MHFKMIFVPFSSFLYFPHIDGVEQICFIVINPSLNIKTDNNKKIQLSDSHNLWMNSPVF